MKKPYVKLYKKQNGFKIFIVDGSYIRSNLNDQFTDFGQHYRFPKMIPTKEFWLDKDFSNEPEYKYFIAHLMKEWELMKKGKNYKVAITEGDAVEQRMRNLDEAKDYKLKRLEDMDGIQVWLVDGEKIRDDVYTDFTEGGHDKVYDWIPPGEIWVDNNISAKERPYVIAHEYNERLQMADGVQYNPAHNRASFYERYLRHAVPNIGRLNAKKSRQPNRKHGRVDESKSLGQMR
jgi:hypothetical protein